MADTKQMENGRGISQGIRELVIARLEVLPEDRKISIGAEGEFSKNELIRHVEAGDEIGRQITELELEFLRGLAQGKILDEVVASSHE